MKCNYIMYIVNIVYWYPKAFIKLHFFMFIVYVTMNILYTIFADIINSIKFLL